MSPIPCLDKKCESCGGALTAKNRRDLFRKRFCSHACRGKGSYLSLVGGYITSTHVCTVCENEFSAARPAQKFCSKKCQCLDATRRLEKRKESVEYQLRMLLNRNGIYSGIDRSKLSMEFLIHLYAKQGGRCAISGELMTWKRGMGVVPTNISIDRIEPKLGYVEDNIQLVCYIVNVMKHQFTLDDCVSWCSKILKYQQEKSHVPV